ncbi:uncharacterized protein LOC125070670 [Vanessa atalanta]|uniref:uncharacterized protein LOC125070670 n=1 Tax=Vanessa atalanta TaxID=42275 RepID=UPI001FCE0425|nr:uncharacterized protein LOC125070670 [Vanessa atalanta]
MRLLGGTLIFRVMTSRPEAKVRGEVKNLPFVPLISQDSDAKLGFKGGQLKNFRKRWEELGATPFILKVISGSRIPFVQRPPLVYPSPAVAKNYATKPSVQMTLQIEELKSLGILEKPVSLTPAFFSRVFLVKKSDGGFRPIFDLRELNRFVKTKHFQLISHVTVPEFLQPGDWLIKADISQAYFHLPITASHRPFLRLFYKQEMLQMTSLPFGLSSAPRLFSAVTFWVAETQRKRGMRILVYLDDFLLVHQNPSKLASQAAEAVDLLEFLGWKVNYSKSALTPVRSLDFLGINWDTEQNIMSLPIKKKMSISTALTSMLTKKTCNLRELQRLLGQLNFACFVIPRGRLHCRHLQIFLRQFPRNLPKVKLDIPRRVMRNLHWWLGAVDLTTPIHSVGVSHFLTTDASDIGWGAVLDKTTMSGSWTTQQKLWHCNKKEMFAVLSAVRGHAKSLRNSHVLLQTDNKTIIAYIRKEGGTHSIGLLSLTFQLLTLLDKWNIILSAQYLPGRYNAIADRLSRRRPIPEWHLLPLATREIFRRWGKPDVDIFASRRRFFKRLELSVGVDISSTKSNTKGTMSSQQGERHLPTGGSGLESTLLESRSPGSSPGPTHDCTQLAQSASGPDNRASTSTDRPVSSEGLENWGWADKIATWSQAEKDLLKKSWRRSTLDTYEPAIKRWITWCSARSSDPKSPRPEEVAQFLADTFLKEGLAYGTMLVHKSAVATFCGQNSVISSNFMVKQVLKAINNSKPPSFKPPIWDARQVIEWLKNNPNNSSLFEIARRTATILLLTSGRRIHDLTLLRISKQHFTDDGQDICFWPVFGAKTDSGSRRQSGWRLLPNQEINLCPVRWIRLLIQASESRRTEDIKHLFITIRGIPKPASKTLIGGWVRSVLKDAGIDASPGSCRSAVASLAWLENRPVEEILERAAEVAFPLLVETKLIYSLYLEEQCMMPKSGRGRPQMSPIAIGLELKLKKG